MKLTQHQEDLLSDDVIKKKNEVTVATLCAETGLSEARVRGRIKYDIEMNRAVLISDNLIHFDLSKMAKRTVKPPGPN